MRFLLLFVLIVTGGSLQVTAQQLHPKTLLWQVTGNGILQPSYLFGTVHLMCASDMALPDTVRKSLLNTQQLYLEIKMDDPAVMMQLMQGMTLSDGQNLRQLVSSATYDSLDKVFQSTLGLSLDKVSTVKPIFLSTMLYPAMLGCQPQSWEQLLQNAATEASLPILGLETAKDQLAALDAIPYPVQASMLSKSALDLPNSKAQFAMLLSAYQDKDIDGIYRMTTADKDFGAFEEALLVRRNKNWAKLIPQVAGKAPSFFAFGAAHMGGKTGVIELLRQAGFSVKPIMY